MKLQPLENTVVNLRTQEEYDEYMQLREDAEWEIPTSPDFFADHKGIMSVECRAEFLCSYPRSYEGCIILTLPELKAKFGIEPSHALQKAREMNAYLSLWRHKEKYGGGKPQEEMFIAGCCNFFPSLVSELEALTAKNAELRQAISLCSGSCHSVLSSSPSL